MQLRILRDGKWIATPATPTLLGPGPQLLSWDGKKRIGRPPDGLYRAELTVTDVIGPITQATVFAVDTKEPTLRLLSRSPRLRIRLSEAAEVVVVADGVRTVVRKTGPGIVVLPAAATTVRAVAYDPAGNKSRVLRAG